MSGHPFAVGIDLFHEGLLYARGRVSCPLIRGDVCDVSFRKPFDLVLLCDVLEHVDDDAAALENIHGFLKPAGTLLLTVPAHPFLWSDFDEAAGHRRRYTRSELECRLLRAGFSVDYLTHFMAPVLPLVWLKRRVAEPCMPADRTRPGGHPLRERIPRAPAGPGDPAYPVPPPDPLRVLHSRDCLPQRGSIWGWRMKGPEAIRAVAVMSGAVDAFTRLVRLLAGRPALLFLAWSLWLALEYIGLGPLSYVPLADHGENNLPARLATALAWQDGGIGFWFPQALMGADRLAMGFQNKSDLLLFFLLPGWLAHGLILWAQRFVAGYFMFRLLAERFGVGACHRCLAGSSTRFSRNPQSTSNGRVSPFTTVLRCRLCLWCCGPWAGSLTKGGRRGS